MCRKTGFAWTLSSRHLIKRRFSLRWRDLFIELDRDNSGTIDFQELAAFLKSADMESLIPTLTDWMTDYDVDGDGQLQYKEFLGFVATLEAWIHRGQCSIFNLIALYHYFTIFT